MRRGTCSTVPTRPRRCGSAGDAVAVIDLSRPVVTGMPVYPGDPEVAIEPALSVEADGVAVSSLHIGSHAGTHLDAPSHSVVGGRTVDRIPLELLVGRARVLRARLGTGERVGAGEGIGLEHFPPGPPERLPRIVLVETGWDRHFADAEAVHHPHLALELVEELWARGARVLGVDALSPDPTDPQESAGLPVHEFWLGGDGVIVENLTGLGDVPDEIEVSLLPLRLEGVDGSPIRAVAHVP